MLEKKAYLCEYYKKEGIQLDPSMNCHNPVQRAINKLLLNCCLTDNLKYFTFISDDVVLVQYQLPQDTPSTTRDINVFIGAFTTTFARLKLYNLMDKTGRTFVIL